MVSQHKPLPRSAAMRGTIRISVSLSSNGEFKPATYTIMQLYNTLTRQKEEFKQITDPVRMYVCGVTTYDEPHLGHALATVIFEVLQSYMQYRGIDVKRVQNFTDVDDKIIDRANENGIDWFELTEEHVGSFLEAMDGLNVRRADVHPA